MNKSTILAIDVGNTSTHLAFMRGMRVLKDVRIPTLEINRTRLKKIRKETIRFNPEAALIASVVPRAGSFLRRQIPDLLGIKTFLLGKDLKVPIVNRYKKPAEVGIDRLVNALAAYRQYKKALIVVDFGTAITFDLVSKKGEYLGGVIAPGIEISLEALFQKTALLPKIRLKHPKRLVARDTAESIRVGCSVGIGGLCDRLIEELKKAMGGEPVVISTGGYARFMAKYCRNIHRIDPWLVMKGISHCYSVKKILTNLAS